MNYKLVMTEGTSELYFLNILLERGLLRFRKEELFFERIFPSRQIDGLLEQKIQSLSNDSDVTIIRVGDKLSDQLKKSKNIKNKIKDVIDIQTVPEFEMLFLIHENLYRDYEKKKNRTKEKPSQYYKKKHPDYHKDKQYIENYFEEISDDEIISIIDGYSRCKPVSVKRTIKSLLKQELLIKRGIKEEVL